MASRNCGIVSSSSGRTCLCSPTSHRGSFRCSLHRNPARMPNPKPERNRVMEAWSTKVGGLKALMMIKLIKPSSHDVQRRRNFQPKRTRFCNVNHVNQQNQVAVS